MKIVEPSIEILVDNWFGQEERIVRSIERAARTCYKSEGKLSSIDEAKRFVRALIKNDHTAMIEHESVSVRIVCDRGISHEIVRHRIASYAQESTRYCNYSKDRFDNQISCVVPVSIVPNTASYDVWVKQCESAEKSYFELLGEGNPPQIARAVLPTCVKTEIVVTMNLREWRHFFSLRCATAAHPDMSRIARKILIKFQSLCPTVFGDLGLNGKPLEESEDVFK